jgi:hypothetical protein
VVSVLFQQPFQDLIRSLQLLPSCCRPKTRSRSRKPFNEARALQSVTREVIAIHFLLKRSFFGDGIPRSLLLPISPAKPTFCSRAILMASQNEASIYASPVPRAVRNTPQSRRNSAQQWILTTAESLQAARKSDKSLCLKTRAPEVPKMKRPSTTLEMQW